MSIYYWTKEEAKATRNIQQKWYRTYWSDTGHNFPEMEHVFFLPFSQ